MNYSKEIKRLRSEAGLSQQGLAAITGIDRRNISILECSKRPVTEKTFDMIINALGYKREKIEILVKIK